MTMHRYWLHGESYPQAHIRSRPLTRIRAVSDDKITFVYAAPIRSICLKRHAGAGRHLPQPGQAVEDALRHARQLVIGQKKAPVGMADKSRQLHPVALSVPAVPP